MVNSLYFYVQEWMQIQLNSPIQTLPAVPTHVGACVFVCAFLCAHVSVWMCAFEFMCMCVIFVFADVTVHEYNTWVKGKLFEILLEERQQLLHKFQFVDKFK